MHKIRYAVATASRGSPLHPPLLVFNGIGAALELMVPVIEALGRDGIGVVGFDVPGTGGLAHSSRAVPPAPPGADRARAAPAPADRKGGRARRALGRRPGAGVRTSIPHRGSAAGACRHLGGSRHGAGRPTALLRLVSPRRYLYPITWSGSAVSCMAATSAATPRRCAYMGASYRGPAGSVTSTSCWRCPAGRACHGCARSTNQRW